MLGSPGLKPKTRFRNRISDAGTIATSLTDLLYGGVQASSDIKTLKVRSEQSLSDINSLALSQSQNFLSRAINSGLELGYGQVATGVDYITKVKEEQIKRVNDVTRTTANAIESKRDKNVLVDIFSAVAAIAGIIGSL